MTHWAPAVHALSLNVSAPALLLGPHDAAHVAERPAQTVVHPEKNSVVQSERNAPGARHEPLLHVWVPLHVLQVTPPVPHALVVVPA